LNFAKKNITWEKNAPEKPTQEEEDEEVVVGEVTE
jgi:hypothetical protein